MKRKPFFRGSGFGWATAVTLVAYLLLKSRSFHWYLSDENIYYYLAHRLDFHTLPYRDFFYANPPLLLLLLKLTGGLFGWTVFGLRVLPIGASVLAGFLLVRVLSLCRLQKLAVFPLAVYWLTYDQLRAGTHATGINVTLTLILAAYSAAFRDKPIVSGLWIGAALWTKTYGVVAVPGLLTALLFPATRKNRRTVFLFVAVVAGGVLLLALAGTGMGGNRFWEMNVAYHLTKPETTAGFQSVLKSVLDKNAPTFWCLVWTLGIVATDALRGRNRRRTVTGDDAGVSSRGRSHDGRNRLFLIGFVHLVSVLVFLLLQKRVFDFYFLLFLPGVCFLMGGILLGLERISPGKGTPVVSSVQPVLLVSGFAFLLVQPLLPNDGRLLFRGPVSYWEHESRTIDRLADLARDLENREEVLLAGDSVTAPLLALLSNRSLVSDEADTNAMRFRSGHPPPGTFIDRIENAGVTHLLMRVRRGKRGTARPVGMFAIPEFLEYANRKFTTETRVRLSSRDAVLLLRRKKEKISQGGGAEKETPGERL